jgi:hypothetical protein
MDFKTGEELLEAARKANSDHPVGLSKHQRWLIDKVLAQLAAANAQRDEAMQRAAKESEALFARNNDVERIAKQRDELLRLLKVERAEGGHADESPVVCRVFWGHECDCGWAKRRNTIDAAIARAQSGQPAQRDDDGTASGGGS